MICLVRAKASNPRFDIGILKASRCNLHRLAFFRLGVECLCIYLNLIQNLDRDGRIEAATSSCQGQIDMLDHPYPSRNFMNRLKANFE